MLKRAEPENLKRTRHPSGRMQALHDLTQSDADARRAPLDSLPNFNATYMKEGPLQKKGQMLKGWKQRWFVCDGRMLAYYSSRRDTRASVVMELKHCTVEDGGRSETWNSTRIHLMDNATSTLYCLTSEDAAIATEWLDVLRNCITRIAQERRQRLASQPQLNANATSNTNRSGATATGPGEKRVMRVVSAPSGSFNANSSAATAPPAATQQQQQPPQPSHSGASSTVPSVRPTVQFGSRSLGGTHVATSVAMENELARDMELLRALLSGKPSHASSCSSPVLFSPLGATNGVVKSVGLYGDKRLARGRVVLSVPSEVALYFVCDHHKRADWDTQFPTATHVAKFDDATELVYLTKGLFQIKQTKPFVVPPLAAAAGALLGGLLASSWATTLHSMALLALIAAVLNSVDYSGVCGPRDLLLLRQIRKSKTAFRGDDIDEDDDDDHDDDHDRRGAGINNSRGQPVITVLEKSVANERKPVASGVIRAHQSLGGWLLEPLDGGRTLVTFVTDLDARGWLSQASKREFMLQRLDSLAVLAEHVNQSQLSVAQLGLDDGDSGDESETGGGGANSSSSSFQDASEQDPHSHSVAAASTAAMRRPASAFHPSDYVKGMSRLPSGGLKLTDKEVAKKQAGVLKEVLKSASGALLEGKGMVGLSLPVRIFEPRTNLERIVDLFLYGPTFLNTAADQREPLERFKFVMAYAVAGLHHGAGQMKPFNPILGETYQTLLNDGTEVYCEHTSHHPPITNFELLGKKYSINGHVVWNAPAFSMKSSAFIQNNAGPIRIHFSDGTVISYHLPQMQSGGFLWGDRTVDLLGSIRFEDRKNGLLCDLKFNPDEKKGMGGMFSSSATPSDFVRGVVVDTTSQQELSAVSGSWLEGLSFDGKNYWTFGKEHSGFVVPLEASKVLESDSVKREDLMFLAANDLDLAQEWKVKLEVLQRADRKIRNDGRRTNHWSLKDGGHH